MKFNLNEVNEKLAAQVKVAKEKVKKSYKSKKVDNTNRATLNVSTTKKGVTNFTLKVFDPEVKNSLTAGYANLIVSKNDELSLEVVNRSQMEQILKDNNRETVKFGTVCNELTKNQPIATTRLLYDGQITKKVYTFEKYVFIKLGTTLDFNEKSSNLSKLFKTLTEAQKERFANKGSILVTIQPVEISNFTYKTGERFNRVDENGTKLSDVNGKALLKRKDKTIEVLSFPLVVKEIKAKKKEVLNESTEVNEVLA